MGNTLIMLHKATGNMNYFDRAQRLAYWLLLEMKTDSSLVYTWHYWPQMDYYPGYAEGHDNIEDLPHASITVEFLHNIRNHGIGVFYDTEMYRLGRTLTENIYNSGTFYNFINGTQIIHVNQGALYAVASFSFLNSLNNNVLPIVKNVLIDRMDVENERFISASGFEAVANYVLELSNSTP